MKEVKLKGLHTKCFYFYYVLKRESRVTETQSEVACAQGGNCLRRQIANKYLGVDWPSDSWLKTSLLSQQQSLRSRVKKNNPQESLNVSGGGLTSQAFTTCLCLSLCLPFLSLKEPT